MCVRVRLSVYVYMCVLVDEGVHAFVWIGHLHFQVSNVFVRMFVCARVANLSHELRTPLNSVIAFNSLLLESGLGKQYIQ